MERSTRVMILFAVVFTLVFTYYLAFLNHTDINEIGVAYDSMSGQITVQDKPGWYTTSPMVRVAYLSTLPMAVEIPSEAAVITKKIVRFKKEGLDDFIRLQGFGYSMSSSLANTLLGYAYSGREWPFLEVMQEGGTENVGDLRPLYKKAP